uniref:Uncharacterized protein n=1 Tax=Arundo donax TaxID=35708 RepID=A0A0A8XVL7_ARUDO
MDSLVKLAGKMLRWARVDNISPASVICMSLKTNPCSVR